MLSLVLLYITDDPCLEGLQFKYRRLKERSGERGGVPREIQQFAQSQDRT